MILTRELEYAIKLLGSAGEGCGSKPLSLKKFATETGISFLFLQQIARKLKAANIILARKGKVGGYWLGRPRNSISLKDIINAIDTRESIVPYDTVMSNNPAKKLNEDIINFLENKKISEYVVS